VTAKRTHASFLLRILKRGFQNVVNRRVDLPLGRINFDSASTTVHDSCPLAAVRGDVEKFRTHGE
jgi:hypothetical protein